MAESAPQLRMTHEVDDKAAETTDRVAPLHHHASMRFLATTLCVQAVRGIRLHRLILAATQSAC
eukprot:scaffold16426_cov109-Isochrysis_galbana.AAC.2